MIHCDFRKKEFRDKTFKWSTGSYYDEEVDSEESLINSGDWRGFPFDSLWNQEENIPTKAIKKLAQDYFRWQHQIINKEKQAAKIHGLFGRKSDKEKWPRKWMMRADDPKIEKFVRSRKGKFFIELLKYLEANKMKMQRGQQIAKKLGYDKEKYVLVQLDRKKAAEVLSRQSALNGIAVSPEKVYRFAKWMADNELIIKLGKPGLKESMVYAIGKWHSFPDQVTGEMRPGGVAFFINYSNRQRLRRAIKTDFI